MSTACYELWNHPLTEQKKRFIICWKKKEEILSNMKTLQHYEPNQHEVAAADENSLGKDVGGSLLTGVSSLNQWKSRKD